MEYIIFRNKKELVRIEPSNTSELVQVKQVSDYISMNFELSDYIPILIGDYISFPKTRQLYKIMEQPEIIEGSRLYKYECLFKGQIHELNEVTVFLTTETEEKTYKDYKFPLTGNAETFLRFIVDNMNSEGYNYTVGTFAETETLTIDFNNWTAFEAITELSESLGFDWYIKDSVLHFDSKKIEKSEVLQVGRLDGFTELRRIKISNEDVKTVIYGYGSTDNLPPRTSEDESITYDSDLLTENRLSFIGVDNESKLEKNTDLYGRRIEVVEFDEIKPEFTGVVSSVLSSETEFIDTSIDFDINEQLMSGISPKITFLTGNLIGLTFNITFDSTSNKITMAYYSDESGQYPNSISYASVGDTYKIFDVIMPETYISDAKDRLKEATQIYIDDYCKPKETYEGELDSSYVQLRNLEIDLGDLIRIVSPTFEFDNLYEIKELTQNINIPSIYTIKFGDVLPVGLIASLKKITFATQQSLYNISSNSVTNNSVTNIVGDSNVWE